MAKDALLDLNTLIERPAITIDGKRYEILSPEELSILDSQAFTFWGGEIEELSKTKGKENELAELVNKVASKVLVDVPSDLKAKLSDAQKFRVVEVFTMLLLRHKIGAVGVAAAVMKDMSPSTGEKSFPASSASSAETPRGGSKKRRRR